MAGPGSQTAGIVLVTLSAVGWSMAGLFTRLVHADNWAITGWRGVFSALAVVLYLAWRGRGGVARAMLSVGRAGLLAATVSTLASLAYIAALLVTSVANVVVVYATAPFVTAGLAWALLRERPARSTMLAAAAARLLRALLDPLPRPRGDARQFRVAAGVAGCGAAARV